MATESLIVELDAKTAKLDKKINKTGQQFDQLDGKVKKTDRSFSKFAAAGAAAATALSIAFAAVARQSSIYAKELLVAAERSNETVENMQAQAFAANTVGISLEKLGDIGKDTQEKIGEFLATGGGGFQDFADVMGLSADRAKEFAEGLQGLSSNQILQTLVNEMERGGVSGQQMSFALEGLASDATDLLPLLKNNGLAMRDLSDEFFDVEQTLTDVDLQKLKDIGVAFQELGSATTNAGAKISSEFSDEIITATALLANLVNVGSKVFVLLGKQFTGVGEILGSAIFDLVNDANTLPATMENVGLDIASRMTELFGEDNPILKALGLDPEEIDKRMKEISGIVDDNLKKTQGITTTAIKKETKADRDKYLTKVKSARDSFAAISVINEAFLEDNKAINAGLIVADTAAAVMAEYKKGSFGAAALALATGLAQLAANNSASKGGGSLGGTVSAPQQQQGFTQETSTLDLTSQDSEGVNTIRVEFATDSGDDLLDALAGSLNNRARQGR